MFFKALKAYWKARARRYPGQVYICDITFCKSSKERIKGVVETLFMGSQGFGVAALQTVRFTKNVL